MVESREHNILTNPSNNPNIDKMLKILGTAVTKITETYSEDDVEVNYSFPNAHRTNMLGVVGDDSIGCVVGAYMQGSSLILIANFGDEGNIEFDTTQKHLEVYRISPL